MISLSNKVAALWIHCYFNPGTSRQVVLRPSQRWSLAPKEPLHRALQFYIYSFNSYPYRLLITSSISQLIKDHPFINKSILRSCQHALLYTLFCNTKSISLSQSLRNAKNLACMARALVKQSDKRQQLQEYFIATVQPLNWRQTS